MSKEEFGEFCDNDYELLEDEEWEKCSFENEKLKKLPVDWRNVLIE